MFTYLTDQLSISVPANAQAISGTGTTVGMVDISNAVGPITITVACPAGGTGTMTITPVMNTVNSTSGVSNVPAAALVAQSGASAGQAATFSNVAASASVQTLSVVKELSMRYLGITFGGSGLTQTATVTITFLKQYTQ